MSKHTTHCLGLLIMFQLCALSPNEALVPARDTGIFFCCRPVCRMHATHVDSSGFGARRSSKWHLVQSKPYSERTTFVRQVHLYAFGLCVSRRQSACLLSLSGLWRSGTAQHRMCGTRCVTGLRM